MLAVAVLPISHETLQYGSDDGGITVKADHPDLNKKMEVRALSLSLSSFCSHFSLFSLLYSLLSLLSSLLSSLDSLVGGWPKDQH